MEATRLSTEETIATVRDLEEAVAILFQNNFDADSKVCVLTLIKSLDNVIAKPHDTKVRTLRLQNAAFERKVGSRRGGVEILVACGFERQTAPPPLLAKAPEEEQLLVLTPQREKSSHLIMARRLLATRAIQELGMKPDELPVLRPPPPEPVLVSGNANSSNTNSNSSTFNPYAGHRFDAMSAAVGTNLGPDSNYVSKTETELQKLQQKQQALEKKLPSALDPSWRAFAPDEAVTVVSTGPSNGKPEAKSDSTLLAEKMKRQQEERFQREQGGFTTKAMRDLEKMKKQKVYSHVTLTIQFPDGFKLLGQFLPSNTIQNVKESMLACFLVDANRDDFDLYITPPRRLLPPPSSLSKEGLAPAAKLFVSWKSATPPIAPYLRSQIFAASSSSDHAVPVSFPVSHPITASSSGASGDINSEDQQKKSEDNREEALLRRMMGGKTGLSGSTSNRAAPSASSGGKKPKWFKP